MQMSDARDIKADRATVWAALLSPEVLKECVPGAQEVTGTPEDGFEATVVQKVGPVKATFKGMVKVSNIVEMQSLTLTGEGKGGAAGYAKGGANVRLEDSETGTRLSYDVEASVGGKLAQLGSRLVDGFAKKIA
ncbi:MAG: carbon monoxide dehydrogenase subunit G, partial [Roseovarius sp.]|nr:carbon monoxide dehydrogenase subunit G [Roseovarius sp.]